MFRGRVNYHISCMNKLAPDASMLNWQAFFNDNWVFSIIETWETVLPSNFQTDGYLSAIWNKKKIHKEFIIE